MGRSPCIWIFKVFFCLFPERLNSRVLSPSDSEQRYDLEKHLEWERKMREWRHRKEAEAMEAANFDSDD